MTSRSEIRIDASQVLGPNWAKKRGQLTGFKSSFLFWNQKHDDLLSQHLHISMDKVSLRSLSKVCTIRTFTVCTGYRQPDDFYPIVPWSMQPTVSTPPVTRGPWNISPGSDVRKEMVFQFRKSLLPKDACILLVSGILQTSVVGKVCKKVVKKLFEGFNRQSVHNKETRVSLGAENFGQRLGRPESVYTWPFKILRFASMVIGRTGLLKHTFPSSKGTKRTLLQPQLKKSSPFGWPSAIQCYTSLHAQPILWTCVPVYSQSTAKKLNSFLYSRERAEIWFLKVDVYVLFHTCCGVQSIFSAYDMVQVIQVDPVVW